jgi:hypothetical protein
MRYLCLATEMAYRLRPLSMQEAASLCGTTTCGVGVRSRGEVIGCFRPRSIAFVQDRGSEFPRIFLPKLSEKGCERRSELLHGQNTEAKVCQIASLQRPEMLPSVLLRYFSNSLSMHSAG